MDNYGYITHIVCVGDSLQKIAIKYGLDDWREIAYLNDLQYPYIDDDITSPRQVGNTYEAGSGVRTIDSSKVAKVGDSLLIPSFNYATAPAYSQVNQEDLEKLAYGSDLDIYGYDYMNEFVMDLSEKGELSETSSGDIRLAEGIRNLRQQLLIELSTPLGALILHPDFGSTIRDMNGMKATKQTLIKIMLEAQRVILKNFRVKEIKDMEITKEGTASRIKCIIIPISPYSAFVFNEIIE